MEDSVIEVDLQLGDDIELDQQCCTTKMMSFEQKLTGPNRTFLQKQVCQVE